MAEIVGELELRNDLADPVAFYQIIVGKKNYRPQGPRVEGDCELMLTDLTARGCIVAATVVHARREAFLILLDVQDALLMQARLGELVPEVTSANLRESMRRRPHI